MDKCKDNTKNYAPCHLPIEGTVHPEVAVVPLDTNVLFVGRVRVRQPCCCVINVNAVGIWHVFDRHWLLFLKEVGFVLDARKHHQVSMDDSCGKVYIYDILCSSCAWLIHHQEVKSVINGV